MHSSSHPSLVAMATLVIMHLGCESPPAPGRALRVTTAAGGTIASPMPVSPGPVSDNSHVIQVTPPVAGSSGPAATETPSSSSDCGALVHEAQPKPGAADIVWVIDGSPSMVDELTAVQQNISAFATTIGAAGIDHHVVMVGSNDAAAGSDLAADPGRYLFVPALVSSNNPFLVLLDTLPAYQPFLRTDASLNFVVVTDDDSILPAAEFRRQMEQRLGRSFFFHAIASEDVNGLPCSGACGLPVVCGAASPGRQYYALAETTGGQKISICASDWSHVFTSLQQAVITSTPLPCAYPMPAPPVGEVIDSGKVNLELITPANTQQTLPRTASEASCGDATAWFYDDPVAPKEIRMCPSACRTLDGGGRLQISVGCATVLQ